MSRIYASGSITLYHTLPAFIEARASQLGLKRHTYFSLLISNFLGRKNMKPLLMTFLDDRSSKVKRLRIQLTLSAKLRHAAQRAASKYQISFSQFVECIVIEDVMNPLNEFVIHPVDGVPKPTCHLPTVMVLDKKATCKKTVDGILVINRYPSQTLPASVEAKERSGILENNDRRIVGKDRDFIIGIDSNTVV